MFEEANSVEDFVKDLLAGQEWDYIHGPDLGRDLSEVLLEPDLRSSLERLNPTIAARPELADEVIYKLRAALVSVRSDGLVRANEEFAAWLRGGRSMPFGPRNEHVPVRLVDFEDLSNNTFVVANQVTFKTNVERRYDLVLFLNGIPLVVGEAKTPTRPAVSWVDGAAQIHNDYEANQPEFFVPNVLSFATEGKTFRYGSVRMPLELWGPWREDNRGELAGLSEVERAVRSMLRPDVILGFLQSFTIFATDRKHRKIKIIARYQQYQAANQIVDRVTEGRIKKGLVWHFQGSGKSLLMVFTAQKLRLSPHLKNPTVLIVVDRVDLDTQITSTFNAADVPNLVATTSRRKLQELLAQDVRKVVITTIHKFGEAEGELNDRDNIIVMVDEAHRTQEGDLGRKMREALPNAFLFGLTGTPINKKDRNTFWAFGAKEDERGYMSRYSFQESIRDEATLPLHFEARLVELRVDRAAIDDAFKQITGHLTEEDQNELTKRAGKLSVLLKTPERVAAIVRDVATHYEEKVEPNGFKAMVVTFDRESCVLYKDAFDEILPSEMTDVVVSLAQDDDQSWRDRFQRTKDEEEKLLDRFRDSADPLKILIVTARLLTGFDAPILQAMYLDKPIRDHNLLQAICRTNRPYPDKTHGLIVDYLGIFDDVAQSLAFDEKAVQAVITNLEELKTQLPVAFETALAFFPDVDRTVAGYEGLLAAQNCLPNNDVRDAFARAYSIVGQLWEALSPDPALVQYEDDYRWLTQVYESVQPPSGHGKLLWHSLGAKTLDLIHDHVHVEAVRDDLDTLVMDAEVLEGILESSEPTKVKEIEIKVGSRIRKHGDDPIFVALGERLEELRQRHEDGLLSSLDFLQQLLELARDVVAAEKEVEPQEETNRGKAALTELFEEVRNKDTPVIVEHVVEDIDSIVRAVRFEGWQETLAGEREVQRALRRTMLKYRVHKEQELFDRAYAYIKQYY
jgi:type I restriction enzyme R subunit